MNVATATYLKHIPQKGQIIKIFDKDTIHLLIPEEIYYLQSCDNYTYIHTKDNKLLSSRTLKYHIEKLCPSQFIRVHRSFCVNKMKIASIKRSGDLLTTRSGVTIPISRSKRTAVLSYFD